MDRTRSTRVGARYPYQTGNGGSLLHELEGVGDAGIDGLLDDVQVEELVVEGGPTGWAKVSGLDA